jgi:hypothetical protein
MTTLESLFELETRAEIRELDHRAGDGMEVWLLWNAETEDVLVSVAEEDGVVIEFKVPPADALDAFHHPYVYAPYDDYYMPAAA